MNIKTAQNVYMVGIKGVGMTSLALILSQMGKKVWGSDVDEEFPTDIVLKENGIQIVEGFKKENIEGDIDLVITTGAHEGLANVEVLAANEKNIPVLTHAQALGAVMDFFTKKIAVCGSHGKTTVSAMIAYVLHKMNTKAGYLVGTPTFSGMLGGGFTGYDYFVCEADEYINSKGSDKTPRFMFLNPDIIICTNLDFDHPDVYENMQAIENAFVSFFAKLDREKGILIYSKDDVLLEKNVEVLSLKQKYPYSLSQGKDLRLQVPGKHNIYNASAVLALSDILKFDRDKVESILGQFTGSKRRFEKIYEHKGIVLYDDYAHHPKEIEATIDAAKNMYPDKKITILFQPHTFSRTMALANEFVSALSNADAVFLLPIFSSARETAADFSSQKLVEIASTNKFMHIKGCEESEIATKLESVLSGSDTVITVGAGSIYRSHSDIIDVINKM